MYNFEQIKYEKGPEQNYKKGKSRFPVYLAIVLITAIITSMSVGGLLYQDFSSQLSSQQAQLAAMNEKLSSINSTDSIVQTVDNKNNVNKNAMLMAATGASKDLTIAEIAKKVSPAIVGIKISVPSSSRYYSTATKSEGSGIIFTTDGYIMTNYHVVEYADPKLNVSKATIEVYLPDKRQAKATFVGGDSENDLAVIKINLNDLPVAALGDSSSLEVGELAVAIGNPLGIEFAGSVTAGIISALNRQVNTGDKSMNLIQTDAAINPGNSGGALVNSKGEVIGINSVKISESGIEGLGFAIPMNTAKPIIDQLKTYGYVRGKPLLGISVQEVTQNIASMYDWPVGLYIAQVSSGGAAEKAGIKKGDILTSLDGQKVKTMSDLDAIKKLHKAGDSVKAVIWRNGQSITVNLVFSEAK